LFPTPRTAANNPIQFSATDKIDQAQTTPLDACLSKHGRKFGAGQLLAISQGFDECNATAREEGFVQFKTAIVMGIRGMDARCGQRQ
jgi:hypothetical protein